MQQVEFQKCRIDASRTDDACGEDRSRSFGPIQDGRFLKDAAVASTCSSRDLLSTCNGSERTVTVPKGGNEFLGRRAEFRGPDPSLFSWPCPLISLLIYIAACLHAGRYSKRFPELFTSQLVNSVPLLFISAVIDSTIHIFFSLFSVSPVPFLRSSRRASFCHPCAASGSKRGSLVKKKYTTLLRNSGTKAWLSRGRPRWKHRLELAIYRSDDATS